MATGLLVKASGDAVVKYPYTTADLRRDNPNTSFPDVPPEEVLAAYGVFPVQRADPPEHDPEAHRPVEAHPRLVGGVWVQHWLLRAALPAEVVEARDDKERKRQQQVRDALREELGQTQPPQSVPGLVERVRKIEQILGIQPV